MASPFRVFRKHQKTLLVVAGVVLMFVFVLGDSLSAILRQIGGPGLERGGMEAGAVAVRWHDGKLTNAELASLVMRRRIVNDFVRGVELAGRMAVIDSGAEPQPLRVQPLVGPETPQQGVEADVLRTRLFADAARQAGMGVSDDNIRHYLQQLGRESVSPDHLRAMLTRMGAVTRGISIDYIFEGLREEMLAHNYLASYAYSLATVTPQQRWQDWLRANDRVVVETAALPVASFLVDVPEPTDAEVSQFYDQYKNNEPSPDNVANTELPSARPAFAIPRKVDIRYVRADYNQLLSKLEGEVTDKEIQDYYDANKQFFIRADSGLSSEEGATGGEGAAGGEGATGGSSASAEAAPAETGQPPADGNTDAAPAPATNDGSQLDRPSRPSPFRLTALEQNADDGAAQADAASAETPATGAPATEGTSTTDAQQGTTAPVEYQPLEEVRDQIRRQLASQKVNEHLLDLMRRLKDRLSASFLTYFGAVVDARAAGKEPSAPPADLADLSTLAKENGLDYGETGPVSIRKLRDLPLGKSVDAETGEPLRQMVFRSEIELYQPISTFDVDNNRYLVVKVGDTPGRVPELSEVRDEVVHAWKLQKAADLAQKHAEEVAAKIQEAGSTLADYFADNSSVFVQQTDPFASLTIGDVPRPGMVLFRLSEPSGVVAAGPDFMRTVFELGSGQVRAVLNHDRSVSYIVRVVTHLDTPEQLRTAYLGEADQWYGLATMNMLHVQEAAATLGSSFHEAAGVDWLRPADQFSRQDEEQ
jgi:hypothetical protein